MITIPRPALLDALGATVPVAEHKSTLPILAHVLVAPAPGGGIALAASDLHTTATANVAIEGKAPPAFTLEAKRAAEIVRALDCDEVSIAVEAGHATIRGGRASFRVPTGKAADFPKLPAPPADALAPVDGPALAAALARVLPSVSSDESRYQLSGAFYAAADDGVRLVATDGHRLAAVTVAGAWPATGVGGAIIPRKGATELRRLLEGAADAAIGFGAGHVFARVRDRLLAVKLIEAKFPPYEQVIPKSHARAVSACRLDLLAAVRRVALMASDKSAGIRVAASGEGVVISGENPDRGEAREQVDATLTGDPIVIGANAAYLADALALAESATVELRLSGDLDPILVAFPGVEGVVGVVMPMRI